MAIHQLNHAVLYVEDAEVSAAFYADVLGFARVDVADIPGAAFMRAPDSTNDHDLGLFSVGTAGGGQTTGRSVGLYHLAWEVDTLNDLREIAGSLADAGALKGTADHGTTKSLYAADPDGLEFEVVWLVPANDLTPEVLAARSRIGRLDLDAEIVRYGGTTKGGIGVSRR